MGTASGVARETKAHSESDRIREKAHTRDRARASGVASNSNFCAHCVLHRSDNVGGHPFLKFKLVKFGSVPADQVLDEPLLLSTVLVEYRLAA